MRGSGQKVVKDPEKLERIAEKSAKRGSERSGALAPIMDDFKALIRLVIAYARGKYRAIPADALVTIVAGLVYVVSPVDLIPDGVPGGLLDDVAVLAWVLKSVRVELDAFRHWEVTQSAKESNA